MDTPNPKRDRLLTILADLPSAAVAFSGGVDSAVVAHAAQLALGDRAVAVTADSPSVARADLADARRLAAVIGIRHVIVPTHEFDRADYLKNAGDRCYHCKTELYRVVTSIMSDLGVGVVLSGANLDDLGDYRPGLTAAAEQGVRHPLQEAQFTKADVRTLAKVWALPVWDRPASPCLSSRLAPGLAVTPERTQRVELAEAFLKSQGVRDCRVRYHDGDLARVELLTDDLARFTTEPLRSQLVAELEALGFQFVTIDLAGFRSGSLNRLVSLELKGKFASRVGS